MKRFPRKFFKVFLAVPLLAVAGLAFTRCGHSHGFWHRDHSERVLKHLDRQVADLDLTAEQDRKYQALRARLAANLRTAHEERVAAARLLKSEFQKPEPDMAALSAEMKKRIAARSAQWQEFPDYMTEFYAMLDARQKALVREEVQDRLEGL